MFVKQRRFIRLAISCFILLLAFTVRLYRLDFQSVWWDEGHSIAMASAPLLQISTLPGMDVHPPGFFAALHGWMALAGRSKFALRYFSLGFSLLTIALIMRFGRSLGDDWVGWWAGLLMALSPFYVAYAQEVRMYAMVTFFATGSVFCLWRLLFTKRKTQNAIRNHYLVGYILFTTASLYTHYFTGFLLFFENLLWLAWFISGVRYFDLSKWGLRLKPWLGSQLAIFLLFVPQLRLALRQVTTYTNPNLNPPTLSHFISHSWQAYTLGLTIDFERVQPYLWFMSILCLAGLLVYRCDRHFTALLGWLLVPMALYFIALQRQPSYQPRYLMLVTPAIFLLMALTLTFRKWTHGLGLVVVAIFVFGLYSYFSDPTYFKDDAEAVTHWLMRETTPNDIVFVDVPHPFHYYANRIPAPTRYLFVDIHTAADTLNREALGRDRLYWVTWWGSDTDPRGVIPYLLQKQAGPPQGEARFPGYHLAWYQLSDRPFSLPNDLTPLEVNFNRGLRLDGLAYSQTLSPGESAWATLHFTQLAPIEVNYKVSLRLRAPEGTLLAQQDKAILNDRHFQTAAWPIDDPALNQALNVYTLSLDDPTYLGPLTLEAVVYDAETLAAVAAYGVPTTNDDFVSAQIGEIEVR